MLITGHFLFYLHEYITCKRALFILKESTKASTITSEHEIEESSNIRNIVYFYISILNKQNGDK